MFLPQGTQYYNYEKSPQINFKYNLFQIKFEQDLLEVDLNLKVYQGENIRNINEKNSKVNEEGIKPNKSQKYNLNV